jgi:glycosyltransferase involved in cell wall biosynthesis
MSEATKETVASCIPTARERGIVIPHGVPDGFEPTEPGPALFDRYDLPERFLLSVSNLVPYKNLVELVEGYARATAHTDLPPLCIAGKTIDPAYERAIRERIASHDLREDIRLLGYVDHDDLPAIHTASDLFVFSSVCENAPVSVVEALACGATITTSDAASMPEICGDAAVYFDADDPDSIAATLASLWDDTERRERLSAAALERAKQFSWERAARETSKLFEHIVRSEDT